MVNTGYTGGCTYYDVANTSAIGCLFTLYDNDRTGLARAVLKHLGSNIWLITFQGSDIDIGYTIASSSIVTLSGVPNGITVGRINGATAFDTTSRIHVYYS